ncbi:AAA family ATPase [Streptomyces sp. XD-27]|uniref:AAA family ATPase n=1 Tax=Streptomyces sp. XD-27 TaxID=3062779 RepID=UPI0026F438E1|nr:AAA family ATPase [Streptomyces sp. XD-27]WKX70379.1 AAA family ATPase [Streptomyces sp. XD-27]
MTAVFVDREDSLARLERAASDLAEGRSGVLVVEGDSGMGKSSLLGEFGRRAQAAGPGAQERAAECPCRVVLVRATPGIGARRPYGPVLDALHALDRPAPGRRRLAGWRRTATRGALAAAPDVLSAAVPGLGAMVAAGRVFAEATVATGSIPGDSLLPVESTVTRQLIDVLLRQARADRPLLLVVDDIQLCDVSTLEFLHLLLPRIGQEPLGLVLGLGLYATAEGNGRAVEQLLDAWQRDHAGLVSRHRLPPLPAWAVRQLVDARLQGHPAPENFAVRLTGATGGHPVFVEQCLRLWRPGDGARVPLPGNLPAAVLERFRQLDPMARELLVTGATMGEFFFSHTLAEVSASPRIQVQDLLHRIEREHGLIRCRRRDEVPEWAAGLGTDWYDFEHRVLQRGIRGEQTEGARRQRHADIAEALPRVPGADAGTAPLELRALIADHFLQAGTAYAAQAAAAHYGLARSVAVEDLSFAQAEQHCRTAIESTRQLPDGHPDRDRRLVEAIELLLSMTEVRWKGSAGERESEGIDALAAEAEQAAHRLGDRLLIARTTLLRGKTLLAVHGVQPSLAKLEEAVERARECGEPGRQALFVAMVEYGRQLPKRDLRAGLRVLHDAERLYASDPRLGEAGNPVLQHARNLNEMQIGVNLFDAGRLGEARQRLLRCTDRLRGETLRAELPIALNYLAQLHLATGSWEEAGTVLREALDFEEERGGDSGWHAYNNALLATLLARDPARHVEAVERARDAWLETQRTWLVNLVPIVRNLYAEVLLETDRDRNLARRLCEDTLVDTRDSGMVRSEIAGYVLRSRIHLHDGATDPAARDARQALALLAEHGDMPALRTEDVLYHAARALQAANPGSEARSLLDRARTEVLRKADSIDDAALRARFLTEVPLNRALLHDRGAGGGETGTG